jgi:hypothetical protein
MKSPTGSVGNKGKNERNYMFFPLFRVVLFPIRGRKIGILDIDCPLAYDLFSFIRTVL